jgi:hypothetical protein
MVRELEKGLFDIPSQRLACDVPSMLNVVKEVKLCLRPSRRAS